MNNHLEESWRILLIDDDEDDYLFTRDMLSKSKGRKVHLDWAATYEAGRLRFIDHPYNAVLVDYDLGGRTGIQLIREFSATTPAPFILLSGRGSFEVDVEAQQAGATMYLSKDEANPLLLERIIRYAIERKQSELALRQSQEAAQQHLMELETIYKEAPVGLCIFDDQLHWKRLNERIAEINGLPIEDHIGKTPAEIVPDVGQQAEAALRHIMQTGEALDFEMKGTTLAQPGVVRHWAEHWVPMKDPQGKVVGISVAAMEITAQKKYEQALQESEQRLRDTLETITDGFFSFDREWRVTYVNGQAARQGGREVGDLLGKVIWEAEPNLVGSPLETVYRRVMKERRLEEMEFYSRQTGSWFQLRVYPTAEGISVYSFDITERKQAEEARTLQELLLHKSEERFRAVWEITQDAMALSDPEGTVLAANPAYFQLYGYSSEEILGQNFAIIFPEAERSAARQQYLDVFASPTIPPKFEAAIQRRDGQQRIVESEIYFIKEDGKRKSMLSVVRDITERKRAEKNLEVYAEELERSNQSLRDFAIIASHDLQEPLRKVQAFGHLLETRFSNDLGEEGKDYIARITSAADRMDEMLQGLLSYARITTQGEPFIDVNLGKIAQDVLSDLEVRVKETKGSVELGELPVIQGDPLQLRQLLQNMIGNALKYHRTDLPPLVVVSCRSIVENRIQITVKDNGIGFNMKDANRIFQPFFRLHGRSEYEGTGMGLAICRKIVERHRGSITAKSTPGLGSTFMVILPIKQSRE